MRPQGVYLVSASRACPPLFASALPLFAAVGVIDPSLHRPPQRSPRWPLSPLRCLPPAPLIPPPVPETCRPRSMALPRPTSRHRCPRRPRAAHPPLSLWGGLHPHLAPLFPLCPTPQSHTYTHTRKASLYFPPMLRVRVASRLPSHTSSPLSMQCRHCPLVVSVALARLIRLSAAIALTTRRGSRPCPRDCPRPPRHARHSPRLHPPVTCLPSTCGRRHICSGPHALGEVPLSRESHDIAQRRRPLYPARPHTWARRRVVIAWHVACERRTGSLIAYRRRAWEERKLGRGVGRGGAAEQLGACDGHFSKVAAG